MSDRLVRETNPPTGKTASPVPQYWDGVDSYEKAQGDNGAINVRALTTAIVDLKSLLDNVGEVQASPTSNTVLDRLKTLATDLTAMQVQIGDTDAAVVNAGAVGSLSAKLRRLTTDLDAAITLLTTISGLDFAEETTQAANEVLLTTIAGLDFAEETTLTAIEVLLTTISGLDFAEETTQAANEVLLTTIAGLDFAEETTLLDFQTDFNAYVDLEVYGNGAPGAHAGEVVGTMYLDITNGDMYASTGAAWVLKLGDIWD